MTLPTGFPPGESLRSPRPVSPRRKIRLAVRGVLLDLLLCFLPREIGLFVSLGLCRVSFGLDVGGDLRVMRADGGGEHHRRERKNNCTDLSLHDPSLVTQASRPC